MPSRWNAPRKPWDRKLLKMSTTTVSPWTLLLCPRRSTWASMEPGFPCGPRNWRAYLVSGRVARKRGKSNSVPSGAQNRWMRKASPSATKGRLPIQQPSKVLASQISPRNVPRLHSASGARASAAASPRLSVATLGDGAPWIWNLVEELFPGAIQIVDRFHAKQHLSELSKAIYGLTSPRAATWAERRHEELDRGQFHALLAAIRRQVARSEEARRCLHYFQSNRERMRYPEFHAQGLCTSTGVVEAGCKVAIGTRLKRAGMHWTVRGANAIIALRCSKLSGRFQDFWERRSERSAA